MAPARAAGLGLRLDSEVGLRVGPRARAASASEAQRQPASDCHYQQLSASPAVSAAAERTPGCGPGRLSVHISLCESRSDPETDWSPGFKFNARGRTPDLGGHQGHWMA